MLHLFVLFAALAAADASDAFRNVLLVVADDLGVDRVAAYGEHPDPGNTPTIDALAAEGVLFRNAWSNPVCTTTRATLLTGRYSFRTGVGGGTPVPPPWLPLEEVTIAELLAGSHESFAVGKWHLTDATPPVLNPLEQGFDHHWGSPGNLDQIPGQSYTLYEKNVDGALEVSTTYATTETVDDALALIAQAEGAWFTYLCFNAPHSPIHKPPEELHSFDLPESIAESTPLHTKAMIEALDTELGRLFDEMDPVTLAKTLVIFVGDNGTAKISTTAPFDPDHAKGSVYEGGVNVPLIVKGPGVVQGAECAALVNTTDIFATVADYLGIAAPSATDSISMKPYFADPGRESIRPWVFAERFRPDGFVLHDYWYRAVRNDRFKLIERLEQKDDPFKPKTLELYDLLLDPFEQTNLLQGGLDAEQQVNLESLAALLDDVIGPWTYFGEALAGTNGEAQLDGEGTLAGERTFGLELTDALPSQPVLLFYGYDSLNAPFAGGTMVPDYTGPGGIVTLASNVAGGLSLDVPLPADVPAGLNIHLQYWFEDAGGPKGWAASNAVAGTTQ